MSFLRYPNYKDSGVEWLGEVPGHWEVLPIKRIVAVPITDGPHETPQFINEGVPFVSAEAVSSGRIDFSKVRACISAEDNERYSLKYSPKLYDIYMVKSGATTGITAIVEDRTDFNIWSPLAVVRCGEEAVPYFVLNFMRSRNFLEAVTLNWSFGTQQNIGMGVIENLYCTLPSLPEQTQIAAFLDRETAKIDELVAEQRRLMELLKEKRSAVISHAVTKGLNPDVTMKPSGIAWLGDVPEHWEISAIKRYADKITDGAHVSPETENGVFYFVSTKDVGADSIDFENCLLTSEQSYEYLEKTGCRPMIGDVLFSKDGTIGHTIVVRENVDFVVASSLIIIRPTMGILNSNFLNWLCQSLSIANQVECFVKGAGLPRLSIQNLTKVVGCFPPLAEQKTIAAFLDTETAKFDTLTAEAQHAIALLQERRTALISAAVTGQIDVRQ